MRTQVQKNFLVIIFLSSILFVSATVRNGIVVIPGIAGSSLYGTLVNASIPTCSSSLLNEPRIRLWASLLQALPPKSHQECWMAKLRLNPQYNPQLDQVDYKPLDGVCITPNLPGETQGIEYLDTLEGVGIPATKYFHDLFQEFRSLGYKDCDTLLGYSFDWRLPLWNLDFNNLKKLIENFVLRYPSRKVVIIAHSYGSLFANTFLNQFVDIDWKMKHIEGFVSIAGAFGGSHKTVRALLSGNVDTAALSFMGLVNISLVSSTFLRDTQRTFGSMYSLIPNPILWKDNTTIVSITNSTYNMNYSLSTWWQLLPTDIQIRAKSSLESMKLGTSFSLDDPNVPVYCLWSVIDTPTTEYAYTYSCDDLDAFPSISYTYGDTTLTRESASYCRNWKSTTFSMEAKNFDHMGILFDSEFNKLIASLITGIPFTSLAQHIVE